MCSITGSDNIDQLIANALSDHLIEFKKVKQDLDLKYKDIFNSTPMSGLSLNYRQIALSPSALDFIDLTIDDQIDVKKEPFTPEKSFTPTFEPCVPEPCVPEPEPCHSSSQFGNFLQKMDLIETNVRGKTSGELSVPLTKKPHESFTPAAYDSSGIGDFDYYLDFHVQDIDECISIKKSRILSEKGENINVSEDIINPAGSENMLGERICVSVRFQDIFDQLNSIGCPDPFNVTQIAFILPALIYKSTYLNNKYMGFTMVECSFRDGNTVFLTCDERKTFVSLLVSSAMEIFNFLKNTKAWNKLVRSDAIDSDTFSEIYEIITK